MEQKNPNKLEQLYATVVSVYKRNGYSDDKAEIAARSLMQKCIDGSLAERGVFTNEKPMEGEI